jgi:MFS family permease
MPMKKHDRSLERNLALIPVHEAVTRSLFWLPIFVLFTRERFDVDGAIVLAGLYYLFVVVVEVPSGWMSDRLGRVPTLLVAALSWIGAHACFLVGDDRFVVILVGQFLLASGFAFLSGTDVSFHFDTLEALGRSRDYGARQARVAAIGYVALAASAVVGGAVALIDLRAAFALSMAMAVVQVGVVSMLIEPPRLTHAEALLPQIGSCLRYLNDRLIGWLFGYGVALVTLEHVASEPMQIWLTGALGRSRDDLGNTPLLAGVLMAVTYLIGSLAARTSEPLARRFGSIGTLVALAILSAGIVTGMALTTSVVAIALVALRAVHGASAPVLLSAEIAPRTEQRHRATLLSINSLAGRLGYGIVLLFVAAGSGDDVQPVLRTLSIISWSFVAIIVVTGYVASTQRRRAAQPAA